MEIEYNDFRAHPPSETFSIRLLFNQCVVIYTKLLKQFDHPEAFAKQPMSSADRKARRDQLKQQFEYGGRDFTRKFEHPHCVEDDFHAMSQRDLVGYVHPENCPTGSRKPRWNSLVE